MFAALQRGAVPQQFGAILVLEPDDGFDAAVVTRTLADRVSAVPRLRQRLAITVTADPDAIPDLMDTAAALQAELDALTRGGASPLASRQLSGMARQ